MLLWHPERVSECPDGDHGRPGTAMLHLPESGEPVEVAGSLVEAGDAAEMLAAAERDHQHASGQASGSFAIWMRASAVLSEMLARGRFLPVAREAGGSTILELTWEPALDDLEDRRRRLLLGRAMPRVAWCGSLEDGPLGTLDAFWRDATDSLVRRSSTQTTVSSGWEAELLEHLLDFGRNEWSAPSSALHDAVLSWLSRPVPPETWTGRLVLSEPEVPGLHAVWPVTFEVVADDDPDRFLSAAAVWSEGSEPQRQALLTALAAAATAISPRFADAAIRPAAESTTLDSHGAWAFLSSARRGGIPEAELVVPDTIDAVTLGDALRLRLRAGTDDEEGQGFRDGPLGELLSSLDVGALRWEATLDGRRLDPRELADVEGTAGPLVYVSGRWRAIDPVELERLRRHLRSGPPKMAAGEVVAAVLAGELAIDEAVSVEVVGGGDVARLARALQGLRLEEVPAPNGFCGELRPYQARGLDWLQWLAEQRLGGCLADDMGLGKTVVALALVLADPEPTLVVCPASVLGNWQHETARFTPALRCVAHHGPERPQTEQALEAVSGRGTIVFTTYAILRRDADLLASRRWHRLVLDEAQHMKNPQSETARAARLVGERATHRLALTGTPVENRLDDLWSILDFCNPGLLGGQGSFRARFSVPVERHGDRSTSERLRRITAPFVLRRRKTDPDVLAGLPPKHETAAFCNLSAAQASLYRDAAGSAMRTIRGTHGMARRGHVLALLTRLKQICDHPWLVAPETPGEVAELSGKLGLLLELIEEVRSEGDRSLVFTQYVQMGHILADVLGGVPFLHGSVPLRRRDEMVRNFQDGSGPDALVVSLRAGGVGLNLSAANRVFHYDRWWNPAVEDQATDRAHRIGQTRDVWVHRLVAIGTLEEHIGALLERKRELVTSVLAEGESFLTELSDDDLASLVALEEAAVL